MDQNFQDQNNEQSSDLNNKNGLQSAVGRFKELPKGAQLGIVIGVFFLIMYISRSGDSQVEQQNISAY